MRTFGVEEELLLVDETTGAPVPVAQEALAGQPHGIGRTGHLEAEMHQEMIEAITRPHHSAPALAHDITAARAAADRAARGAGARAVALATSPIPATPHPTESARYLRMMGTYGALPRRSLTCGMHVHVAVESDEEGVAILDRIRGWLPLLVAVTANSPFADGEDTGHASWRTVAWQQWPQAGPTELFGDVAAYREHERRLLASEVLLDGGMLYFAARLSRNLPTVEVRVSDVPLDVETTTTVAALTRALVDTAAAEWRSGLPPLDVSTAQLRLATWQAALVGVGGPLIDPTTGLPTSPRRVLGRLLAHVQPALEANGDDRLVTEGLAAVLEDGTGADLQRRSFRGPDMLADVVRAAVQRTHRLEPELSHRLVA
jgi:glutamate---cysteine ligase / carboxylate-amine ligase